MLDGRRRQRAAYVRVPTGAPRELDFVGLPLSCRGGVCTVKGMNHRIERERLIFFAVPKSSRRPRLERRRLRGAAVTPPSSRKRRGGVEGPPTVRLAGGGGMLVAHGKIAYLSLPFCALVKYAVGGDG